jgi:hypothetical protein
MERIYSPGEMRGLLLEHGFDVVAEHGSYLLPMLWIPELGPAMWSMRKVDWLVQRLPANPLCYSYMFVCKKASHV